MYIVKCMHTCTSNMHINAYTSALKLQGLKRKTDDRCPCQCCAISSERISKYWYMYLIVEKGDHVREDDLLGSLRTKEHTQLGSTALQERSLH